MKVEATLWSGNICFALTDYAIQNRLCSTVAPRSSGIWIV